MAQEVPYITIKSKTHAKASNIGNLVQQQKNLGFPVLKKPAVEEYITIPFPDFCTLYYEITIWAQYESQMNEILEKIFYNYDFQDSFVMWSEYDNATKKGNGYRFVGFRDGNVQPQSNIEELSDQERVIKHTYNIRVPAYLILDPKDEALAYGRNKSTKRTDDNSKYVYKNQNAVAVQLKEELVSHEIVESLNKVELDLFSAQQDKDKADLFNLLSRVNGGSGGGGGGTSPTFDTAIPQPLALVGSAGSSARLPNSDHVHPHGDLPGGSLHATVSDTAAGFAPILSGNDTWVLTRTGISSSWLPSAGSTPVTGSDNFFINEILTVSGSIVNPVGHLILSSSVNSLIVASGAIDFPLSSSATMPYHIASKNSYNLVLSSSSGVTKISGALHIRNVFGPTFITTVNPIGVSSAWSLDVTGPAIGSNGNAARFTGGGQSNGQLAVLITGGGTQGAGLLVTGKGAGYGTTTTTDTGFGLISTSTSGVGARIGRRRK
jgi:hypothetical protein